MKLKCTGDVSPSASNLEDNISNNKVVALSRLHYLGDEWVVLSQQDLHAVRAGHAASFRYQIKLRGSKGRERKLLP